MAHSKLTWEEVSQYDEVLGYGQKVWTKDNKYYLVANEGGISEQRVVYELPSEMFQLLKNGERNLGEIHSKLQDGQWPPTKEHEKERDRKFITESPISLITNPQYRALFTQEELYELIPKAEQQWKELMGELPEKYVSPLEK